MYFLADGQPLNDGVAVFLTILILLAIIAASVGMFFLIRRNILKDREEHEVIVESAITKNAMVESVSQYIKKVDRFGALTLMYVDIDGFGDLNDVFGKEPCDQIIKEMANRIVRVLPYKAALCRYDNDEFMIFIKDEDNQARNERLAARINEVMAAPYQVLVGENISITGSVGIATYPTAGANFDELYSSLELATYVSKRDGGNKFTSFYASIVDEEMDNMNYYREIKHAIANKEFTLYYQPIIDLKDKIISGCEALMRWNHPTKGVQAPATFLKVLEQSGDIKWVGEWGIETMIRVHNELKEKFPTIPLRFSLNLSTKQLLDPTLSSKFIDLMNKAQAKPEDYMLEIADFMMMERIAVIKTNIYKLRDFGFKIAVDGFELDGQSVQNIQRSPVDVIKLGRNFLRDVENNFMKEKLLQILVKFAQDNGKTLVCEGIETAEITKYVKEQNVFLGQGYYFAKPLNEEAFTEYIDRHQYSVLLEDVAALEDNENIINIGNDDDDDDDDLMAMPSDDIEESPEELLARTVRDNK